MNSKGFKTTQHAVLQFNFWMYSKKTNFFEEFQKLMPELTLMYKKIKKSKYTTHFTLNQVNRIPNNCINM